MNGSKQNDGFTVTKGLNAQAMHNQPRARYRYNISPAFMETSAKILIRTW